MVDVLTAGLLPHALAMAQSMVPREIELVVIPDDASEADRIALTVDANLFFGSMRGITSGLLEAMAGYRLVQLTSAGYDGLDLATIRRLRLPVATNGGANAGAVAEHTIMLMLACLKNLCRDHAIVLSGGWRSGRSEDEPHEIEGKTVGLIGFGQIGQAVARRLRGWGVHLVYHDIVRCSATLEQKLEATFLPLDDLLGEADIISLHVSLSDETRHLISHTTLERCKPGAILINTCRGGVVDETALYRGLTSGRLAAAGLDVLDPEPPDGSNPLLELGAVTFTPHTAGNTVEMWRKTIEVGFANLLRVIRGERPRYIIPEIQGGA